jgi:GNAT superfamily N-acetyltransferase
MSDEGAAVAIWRSEPEEPLDSDAANRIAEVSRSVFGSRLAVIEAVDAQVLAHRPTEPHHFLGTMGVLPHRQREGLGSAVLRPVLDELDRTGTPGCLETSSAGNVEFYATLGFTVLAHLDELPSGAPATWVLWRPPASKRL